MKIFNAEQIYAADKFTIEKQQITSDSLMERAASQIFEWMNSRLQGANVRIHLFCGIGNNGGDGIALARHLKENGYSILVYVVNYSEKRSKDFLINLDRLKERKLWPEFLDSDCEFPELGHDDIIVDAIFGIGLNRSPDDWVVKLINHINDSGAFILSIDVPSGLFLDRIPEDSKKVVRASHVLSFQAPKLVFFLPETGIFLNQWELLDIGLDQECLHKTETDFELIGKSEVLPMYMPRLKFSHKGSYGHSMIVGGSYGKIGAVNLAAKACLKTGSGLVTAYVPKCGYIPLQASTPELMVMTDDEDEILTEIESIKKAAVVGIGMGMGVEEKTTIAFSEFLDENTCPLVLDADALNILADDKELLKKLPKESVLTPHPKEFERLAGKWKDDFDKLRKAREFSIKYNCILVLKGAHTITFYNGKGYINATGNPGMATAGSGDVLTGMITALVAQNYPQIHAAIFGVYLHGLAGDMTVMENGYEAVTATDILNNIGKAFVELFKRPSAENQEAQ
ncbi:bifunctional ADP-dependent NAD(P)H-hydrate dehydratase/NAD(P)H-hydrate epimerase [Croceitalea sp. MTPC9]|uniref:NAD(P)H-hydrate dehydratase n=1 Tax=unclassified Croceitalea TaxID=2632280 RepID=UPI002B3DEF68|nr:bifunctional ADP-dependent NAD(P)H-hydrate dehydratase/NAD(P)H-hydrate epimerase [Croceitalea sp. MTPC6]GMN16229.1 bifunctional ADP-dependent NAD(P)H-hydrate dehydratase/NAD(P)H-hydrate epimerase [Croceitalea sp. MTPC9]